MNNFIVYVNGVLVSPDTFDVVTSATGEYGNIAQATCRADEKLPGKEVRNVDVLELRSGICVRRYRYERPATGEDKHLIQVPGDAAAEPPDRIRFRCQTVPNAF